MGTLVLAVLCSPLVVVVLASLDPSDFFTFPPQAISARWYLEVLGDETWRNALSLSLTIAVATALLATGIGAMAGIGVARAGRRSRVLLNVLLVAPLAVPVIVLAIAYYGAILRLHLVGNIGTFVIANTILNVPLVTLFASRAAAGANPMLEHASLSLGASRWRTLRKVTLPVVAPAAVAGGLLAFLASMDEVVMSIFLVAPQKTPLAVKMFLYVQESGPPVVMAASSLLIAGTLILVGAALAANRWLGGGRTSALEILGGGR